MHFIDSYLWKFIALSCFLFCWYLKLKRILSVLLVSCWCCLSGSGFSLFCHCSCSYLQYVNNFFSTWQWSLLLSFNPFLCLSTMYIVMYMTLLYKVQYRASIMDAFLYKHDPFSGETLLAEFYFIAHLIVLWSVLVKCLATSTTMICFIHNLWSFSSCKMLIILFNCSFVDVQYAAPEDNIIIIVTPVIIIIQRLEKYTKSVVLLNLMLRYFILIGASFCVTGLVTLCFLWIIWSFFLPGKTHPKMTCYLSSGTLNFTHYSLHVLIDIMQCTTCINSYKTG